MDKKTSNSRLSFFLQDIGVLALFISIFFGAAVIIMIPSEIKLEFIIMLLISFSCMLLAAYRLTIASVVFAGLQITVYMAYKLFFYYSYGDPITIFHYIWIIYPLFAVGAMIFFMSRNTSLEVENEMLKEQVDKLVIIDALTGLYNLKGLYLDLQGQAALAGRKGMDFTLMIISFRYEMELKKVLGNANFNKVKQNVASMVQDTLRIEDRVYSIDEKGSLAIILSCDNEGAEIVKRRINNCLASPEIMPEIIKDRRIKIDLQFGYLQYNATVFGRDMISYKKRVESEMQYDV